MTSSHRALVDNPHRHKPTTAENTNSSHTLTRQDRAHRQCAKRAGEEKRPSITVPSPLPSPIRVSAPIAVVQSSHHSSTARSRHRTVGYARGTSNCLQGGFYSCRMFDCECSLSVTFATSTTLHLEDDILPCPNKSFIQWKVEPIFRQKQNWGRSTSVFSTFLEFYHFPLFLTEITKYNTN